MFPAKLPHMQLNWSIEPAHVRLFVSYLCGVICFAVVRSVQLAGRLHFLNKSASSSEDRQTLKLFATCEADIASIRRLVPLTLGISLLAVIGGAFSTWYFDFATSRLTGSQAAIRANEELFARFSLGLFVSIVLYALASYFQAVVARRKIKLDLF
jgi:hypothetical protein